MAGRIGPLAGLDVDVQTDQTDPGAAVEGFGQRPLGLVVIDRISGQLAQRAELDQQGAGLGRIADGAADLAGAQVDVGVRQPGLALEHRQQALAQILGQLEQALVAAELVAGDQPAEQADGDLEVLHVHVVIERELGGDQLTRFGRFLVQAQQDQRIQRVHRRHQQRLLVPVARLAADRLEIVMALRELHVTLPRMTSLGLDLFGHACGLGLVHCRHVRVRGLGGRRRRFGGRGRGRFGRRLLTAGGARHQGQRHHHRAGQALATQGATGGIRRVRYVVHGSSSLRKTIREPARTSRRRGIEGSAPCAAPPRRSSRTRAG